MTSRSNKLERNGVVRGRMQISLLYSDEHLIELGFDVVSTNITSHIACYTQIERLCELGVLCEQIVGNPQTVKWVVGSKEYTYLEMIFHPFDKHGHIQVDLIMLNRSDASLLGNMYCECSIMLELGQIEILKKNVDALVAHKISSVVID